MSTQQDSTKRTASRRKFLMGGAAVATGAAAATVAAPHVARAQTAVIKMQGAWGGGIFKEFAIDYVNRVNEMSGGSLKVDYLDVGAVVKTAEMQTAVHKGVLDGAHFVTAYWYSKNAAASLFGTGPCWGWTANQLLGWIKYGGGQELYDELMNDVLRLNLVGFFTGPMPAQPFGWFKQEVKTPDDIKGLKYRTVGLAANVLQEMGMSVVQLPGGEIQPAMERGLIDAAEFNNPTSDKDFGMQDVSKHYHLASFHQSQESFEIIFNKDKYNALSKEHQAILKYASESASADMSWKYQDRYSNDLIALKKEYGVNVYRTPDSVMAAQLKAWDVIVEQFTSQDPFFNKVVESQKAWAKRVGAYELTNAPDYGGAYRHYFGEPV
ncbi:MAG: TRAP transporter substrate-binding protein [Minwuiales bacterium]|nr:TRAP transporter substrate-binding protein [Minwuiales bacterium]